MRNNFSFVKKAASFVLVITLFITSCKKEQDVPACTPTMAAIAGTYRVTGLTYRQSSNDPEQNLLLFYEDCEKDDLLDLLPNGTWNYRDIGNVCSPPGSDNGVWSISGKNVISDGILNGTIERFDCHTLVLYIANVFIPNDRTTITIERQ